MKKNAQKIISLVFAVLLIASGLPAHAAADGVDFSGVSGEMNIMTCSDVTIDADTEIKTLRILPSAVGCRVTLNGCVDKLVVSAGECVITGSGHVQSSEINAADCSISVCPGGYAYLGSSSSALAAPETLAAGEKLTVSAQVKNIPYSDALTYRWYSGKDEAAGGSFGASPAENPGFSPEIKYSSDMADNITVGFSLTYASGGGLEYKYTSVNVKLLNYPVSHYYELEAKRVTDLVATYQYKTSVLYNCFIYKDSALKTRLCYVQAGTPAVCVSSAGLSAAEIMLADGTAGWLPFGGIRRASGNCTRAEDYSSADKELWINAKKYKSSTDRLVWVSLGCQKVNVFSRTDDGWKLTDVFNCASGSNSAPTPTGTYKISYHVPKWDYGSYWCGPVTGFFGNYAFHSWLNTRSGGAYDHTMGRPVSHGCIRMEDKGAKFMYGLPMGTAVVVY